MSEDIFEKIILEWEGDSPIFNDIDPVDGVNPGKMQARFFVKRSASLLDMIGRFLVIDKLSSKFSGSLDEKLLLAFCIMVIVNPFKIKYLKGNGIDTLIDAGEYDDETEEIFISERDFLIFCKEKNIDSSLLNWLVENEFVYIDSERIIFRNKFKRGNIIQYK